jgi:N-acetylglutamate synthase
VLSPETIPEALRVVRDPLLARIEDAALTASQPGEQAFYDGWVLRYANGKAKRARSVNLLGPGERPLEEKLQFCAAFYARHGVPFMLRLTPFSPPAGIDEALARAGFAAFEDTRVMVLQLDRVEHVESPEVPLVTLDPAAFGAALAALHGLDAPRAAVERDRFARSAAEGIYIGARSGGRIAGCGSAVLDGDLVGIFGMVTAAEERGRGLATCIVRELLAQARARGCTTAYLQVPYDNAAARRTYARFGFRDGYAYWYRIPPTAKESRP